MSKLTSKIDTKGGAALFKSEFNRRVKDGYVAICFAMSVLIGIMIAPFFVPAGTALIIIVIAMIAIVIGWAIIYVVAVTYADFCLCRFHPMTRGFLALLPFCLLTSLWTSWMLFIFFGISLGVWDHGKLWITIVLCALFTRSAELSNFVSVRENISREGIPFLERINEFGRIRLLRLESQDHYVFAVTELGSYTIRMRFSDALKEVEAIPGRQVHRSHWVAQNMVQGFIKQKAATFLVLQNGDQVPVARSRQGILTDWDLAQVSIPKPPASDADPEDG